MPDEWRDCTHRIYQDIEKAKEQIRIASYWFTHVNVIMALRDASKRNISVVIIFDKSTPNLKTLQEQLKSSGIKFIQSDVNAARMYHKFIVIDNMITWVGSANFTGTGFRKNYENLLRIESTEIVQSYLFNFNNLTRIFRQSVDPVKREQVFISSVKSIQPDSSVKPISDYQKKFLVILELIQMAIVMIPHMH